ncbi:asparaginyl-tRNA synthetase [Tulasnella sp. 418]|nr:asparaginyl-tRNA synthetase [Tulasnella sp. 418]
MHSCLRRPSRQVVQLRAIFQQRDVSTLPKTIKEVVSNHTSPTATEVQSDTVEEIHGWIKSIRKQKRVAFAEIRDGTTFKPLQAVLDSDLAKPLHLGMSVSLKGKIVRTPKAPQPLELSVQEVKILGECDPEVYPIQKKTHTHEHLREHVHLRPRTSETITMLRLRDKMTRCFHDFYGNNDFIHVHTPILTSSDCEGAGEVFRVKPDSEPIPTSSSSSSSSSTETIPEPEFFNTPAYLTVSSQLHLEVLSAAHSRVYTISPTFRAERSQTNRHLSEFWMLEAEMSFTEELDDVMNVVESSIKHVMRGLLDGKNGMEVELLGLPQNEKGISWIPYIDMSWKRMTYTEAIEALQNAGASLSGPPPVWGESLSSDHEKWLAGTYTGAPVFITDYPTSLKPFYMRLNESSPERQTVACFDLLIPGLGELVGGSLREERLDYLERALEKHGLSKEEYSWYLDLRRFGSVKHGGYGVGFERLVSWLSGLENVRECIAFPRWGGRMAG